MGKKAQKTKIKQQTAKRVQSVVVVSYILMSCIPVALLLLIVGWFVFPYTSEMFPWLARFFIDPAVDPLGGTWWLLVILTLVVILSFLGSAYLAIKVIKPVIRVSQEVQRIVEDSDVGSEVETDGSELGELSGALSKLRKRINENMNELKDVGVQTKQLNAEMQRRMVVLANITEIGECIGNAHTLDSVLNLIVERLATIQDRTFSFLFIKENDLISINQWRSHRLEAREPISFPEGPDVAIIDMAHKVSGGLVPAWQSLSKPNLILQPVMVRGKFMGWLAFGNYEREYIFSTELLDTLGVFAKQTIIAIENEWLTRQAKALSVKDELTGLYNEEYIVQRLDEEIKRAIAYQRPCSLVIFTIDRFEEFKNKRNRDTIDEAIKKIGSTLQNSITDIDRCGRFKSNEFAVLLPERNKRQAVDIAETIRSKIENVFNSASDSVDRLTVSGCVAENPLDGVTANDLLSKSRAGGSDANGHGLNVVVS